MIGVGGQNVDAKAAGINHFTWILDLHLKGSGEGAYPMLQERLREYDPNFQPLSRKLFDTFGFYPSPGDDHIGEYLPYAHEFCGLTGFDFEAAERYKEQVWDKITRMLRGELPITELLNRRSGERVLDIISGILSNANHVELAVNIPNEGLIPNLPADAIVEVPAVIGGNRVSGISTGPLPAGIATLCKTQIGVQELAVEAAVTGSRDAALRALLADPVVHSAEAAENTLDELLSLEAECLPQF